MSARPAFATSSARARNSIITIALSLFVASCSGSIGGTDTVLPTSASLRPSPSWFATGVHFHGEGLMNTAPQYFDGTYSMHWKASNNYVPCSFNSELVSVESLTQPVALTSAEIYTQKEIMGLSYYVAEGSTYVYNLPYGDYYIAATSTCGSWDVTFSPKE